MYVRYLVCQVVELLVDLTYCLTGFEMRLDDHEVLIQREGIGASENVCMYTYVFIR